MWPQIKNFIYENQKFILTTHTNPDGDGIGAISALTELLIQMGKSVRVVIDSPIPKKYQFLDYHGTFELYDEKKNYENIDALIILDTNRKERIGRLAELLENPRITSVCIDHHPIENPFTSLLLADPKACSTGAIIHALFKKIGFDLDLLSATGIYTSIIYDTGRFSYSSTNGIAHKIAQECIKLGLDPDVINNRLFQTIPLEQVKIFAKSLERVEVYFDNKVLVQSILLEDYESLSGVDEDYESLDFGYMLEFDKCIENIECVVLLRELPSERVRLSIRAIGDLDVSKLVKQLGGGGHKKAAGATCLGSIDEVKQTVLGWLNRSFSIPNTKDRASSLK